MEARVPTPAVSTEARPAPAAVATVASPAVRAPRNYRPAALALVLIIGALVLAGAARSYWPVLVGRRTRAAEPAVEPDAAPAPESPARESDSQHMIQAPRRWSDTPAPEAPAKAPAGITETPLVPDLSPRADRPVEAAPFARPPASAAPAPGSPEVELLSSRESHGYGYHRVEGEVKNLADRALEHIEVVIEWYTASDEFITRDEAMFETDPIPPGQTASYRVMTPSAVAMAAYRLTFKPTFGGELSVKDSRV